MTSRERTLRAKMARNRKQVKDLERQEKEVRASLRTLDEATADLISGKISSKEFNRVLKALR
jgi:hypothetical protein